MKRNYQKIKSLLPITLEKQAQGMSRREIEEELGLDGNRPIHSYLRRVDKPDEDYFLFGQIVQCQKRCGQTQ